MGDRDDLVLFRLQGLLNLGLAHDRPKISLDGINLGSVCPEATRTRSIGGFP